MSVPRFLSLLFALCLTSSCALQGAGLQPNSSAGDSLQRVIDAGATGEPSLIFGGGSPGEVALFNDRYKQIGKISTPGGFVAVDKQANIYVADYAQYAYKFKIFAPPYTHKPTIISFESIGMLRGFALDWKTGVFAVMTLPWSCCGNPGSISFFRHGAATPCAVVNAPPGMGYFGTTASFDASGDLFLSYDNGNGFGVTSVSGECSAKGFVLYTPILPWIVTLRFNTADQLVVDETTGFNNPGIFTFAHPKNGVLGKQIYHTVLNKIDGEDPGMMTLTADGKMLWASSEHTGKVALFKYPEGGAAVATIPSLSYMGAATANPPLIP